MTVYYFLLQEFVRQQVAEKERAKLEEKHRKEREDAIEEARLARERDRMKADFEREKEKARRKEVYRPHKYYFPLIRTLRGYSTVHYTPMIIGPCFQIYISQLYAQDNDFDLLG
jgi:hypothetical protein